MNNTKLIYAILIILINPAYAQENAKSEDTFVSDFSNSYMLSEGFMLRINGNYDFTFSRNFVDGGYSIVGRLSQGISDDCSQIEIHNETIVLCKINSWRPSGEFILALQSGAINPQLFYDSLGIVVSEQNVPSSSFLPAAFVIDNYLNREIIKSMEGVLTACVKPHEGSIQNLLPEPENACQNARDKQALVSSKQRESISVFKEKTANPTKALFNSNKTFTQRILKLLESGNWANAKQQMSYLERILDAPLVREK
jgi:hypothetical protein